jgi:hypothetical protein
MERQARSNAHLNDFSVEEDEHTRTAEKRLPRKSKTPKIVVRA